jgi:UTP--glucose-1-phosphate uridylyltransferase
MAAFLSFRNLHPLPPPPPGTNIRQEEGKKPGYRLGMVAILPAAGRGTRMSGVGSGSKELLPLGGKPVIQHVVEEARRAGATEIVVVASSRKPDILAFCADISVALQEQATGLAPAVLAPGRIGPTLILLPDTVFHPGSPSARLVAALSRGFDLALAVERVEDEAVSRYGIVEWTPETGRISRILEKPRPDETASRWAITARFALSDRTMFYLKNQVGELIGGDAEIALTPILNGAIGAGHTAVAIPLEQDEIRLDCGNPEGYRRACGIFEASL